MRHAAAPCRQLLEHLPSNLWNPLAVDSPAPMSRAIRIEAVVERHHARMPRYVVVPSSAIAQWRLEGTTIVEGTFRGIPLGRCSLKRWDEKRWYVELRADWCRRTGISTGDRAHLVLEVASTELPDELVKVLSESEAARNCWNRMTANQRRTVLEDVLAAKRSETRTRRARRALRTGDRQSAGAIIASAQRAKRPGLGKGR